VTGARVLVTGATGFIGRRLCAALRELGAEVHGIARSASAATLPEGCVPHGVDLATRSAVTATVARVRPELVFHLAGVVTGARGRELVLPALHANVVGSVNLLDALADTPPRRVVMAASAEEAGGAVSAYAASKLAAGAYAELYAQAYGLPIVTARIFFAYGPGQTDSKLVPSAALALLRGEQPRIASPDRFCDFVHVDDVVDGLVLAGLRDGIDGSELELGTGIGTAVRRVVGLLAQRAGSRLELKVATAGRGSERDRVADPRPALELLSWRPRVLLADGLADTFDWYAAREGLRVAA
jgi:nucleoside-diphosphate-sugar epimerase